MLVKKHDMTMSIFGLEPLMHEQQFQLNIAHECDLVIQLGSFGASPPVSMECAFFLLDEEQVMVIATTFFFLKLCWTILNPLNIYFTFYSLDEPESFI